MDVIEAVISPNDTEGRNARLDALAFSGLRFRNACSLMNRVTDINQKGIDDLQKSCQEYFICSSLFSTSVTLRMWTVGLCAPYHSRSLFSAFQAPTKHSVYCFVEREKMDDILMELNLEMLAAVFQGEIIVPSRVQSMSNEKIERLGVTTIGD
ncbi:hypothetical protein P5673_021854 [Acropora cervicornis]|uniref:Uncharacterized protein n=1 Tax=Acropora cervicornis TaxID=6130 RepID=A0AAD9UZZ8_ACRCE|nr:hypothetical protein P5673_021854 [Acropora cervicornis]